MSDDQELDASMARHPAGGVSAVPYREFVPGMRCDWCGHELVSGAYTQVGGSFFHNGGSIHSTTEPDCYAAWSRYDAARKERGSV